MKITRGIFDWRVACFFLRQIWDPCQPVLWNILLWERTLGCWNEELSQRTKRNCLGKWQPSSLFCMYGDQKSRVPASWTHSHVHAWEELIPGGVTREHFQMKFQKDCCILELSIYPLPSSHCVSLTVIFWSIEYSNQIPIWYLWKKCIPVKSSRVSITTRSSTRVWSLAGRNLDWERPLIYGTITYDTPEKLLSNVNTDWSIIRTLRNCISYYNQLQERYHGVLILG